MMPEKIPDFILLKESRREVGQLKAEIDHLTAENKRILGENERLIQMGKLEASEFKKEERYRQLRKQITDRNKTIHKLRATNSEIITKLVAEKQTV